MEFLIASIGTSSQYEFDEFMEEFGGIVSRFSPRRVASDNIGGENSIAINLNSLEELMFLRKNIGKEISISEFVTLANGEIRPMLTINNLPECEF